MEKLKLQTGVRRIRSPVFLLQPEILVTACGLTFTKIKLALEFFVLFFYFLLFPFIL